MPTIEGVEHLPLGEHHDLPEARYHAAFGLGSTAVRAAADYSVAHYQADREKGETKALRRGSLHHIAILEPERFDRDFVVAECGQCQGITGKGAQCSKNAIPGASFCGIHGGKDLAEEWIASMPEGTEIVTAKEKEQALATAEGVRAAIKRSDLPWILDGGQREVSYVARAAPIHDWPGYEFTTEPGEEGLIVRARADIRHPGLAFDLKGCARRGDLKPRKWAWKIQDYGLHVQAALYKAIIKAVTGDDVGWAWVAHEASAPYAIRVFDASEDDIIEGMIDVYEGLKRWSHYQNTGDPWKGYPTNLEVVNRPEYLQGEKEWTGMIDDEE